MKILNVNPFIDTVTGGGTAERTVQMSRHQSMEGHEVTILTTDFGIDSGQLKGLDNVFLEVLTCFEYRFFTPKLNWKRISSLVSESDIIHLMGHWTLLNVVIFFMARNAGVPYVACPAGALAIFGRSKFLKKIYNFFVGRNIIRSAEMCIAVTRLEVEEFINYGVTEDKITVIPNGVDTSVVPLERDGARKELQLPDRAFILFLGRLNLIKGPDILLEAFQATAQDRYDLVFVGPDGGTLAQLTEYCDRDPELEKRVHFIGALHGDDKYQAYYAADVLFVPSRKEAMSIVAIEAGITGTPVVLTDQCGFDEVEQVRGGLVVEASVEGVQRGIQFVVEHFEELKDMGGRLKKLSLEQYSWCSVVKMYNQAYEKIIVAKR